VFDAEPPVLSKNLRVHVVSCDAAKSVVAREFLVGSIDDLIMLIRCFFFLLVG